MDKGGEAWVDFTPFLSIHYCPKAAVQNNIYENINKLNTIQMFQAFRIWYKIVNKLSSDPSCPSQLIKIGGMLIMCKCK